MLLTTISSIGSLLQKHLNVPFFYVVPDPNWAIGLEEVLPRYSVVCADMSSTVDQLEAKGIPVFCAQRDVPDLDPAFKRSSSSLLRLPAAQAFITQVSRGEQSQIIVFKTSPAAEKAAAECGYRLLAVDSRLNRRFEDKISILSELEDLGQGAIESLIGRVSDLSYDHLTSRLGGSFVIQFSRGFAGNSTVFITSADEYGAFAASNEERRIKCSRFISGQTLTINACVSTAGILHSHYFHQIIGQTEFNRFAGGTSGNDYAYDYHFSPVTDDRIRSLVRSMGEYMKGQGYRGIFGLDLVVEDGSGKVYIIENNARLIASIPVFTKLQLESSEIPMLLFHLLEHMGIDYELDVAAYNEQVWHCREASQLILRNTRSVDRRFFSCPKSGIYDLQARYLRPGCSFPDLRSSDECLLLAASAGGTVGSNIEFAQIQIRQPVIQSDRSVRPEIRDLARTFKELFQEKAENL